MEVWGVWTECGEYEQFSRDLRGLFATEELADAHANQLRPKYDLTEVIAEPILDSVPVSVPFLRWAAHIGADGTEDAGSGFHRGRQFDTWSNEIAPARGRIDPWGRGRDLYIEVFGSDQEAVAAEYNRLLAEARERLRAAE